MKPWLVIAAVASMLAVPVASADWSQAGYDAARTFHTPDPGPAQPDVAFQVELPGSTRMAFTPSPAPLIHDGYAYVSVRSVSDTPRPLDLDGVARVNLSTTQVERFIELDGERRAGPMAIVQGHLLLVTSSGLAAYRLSDGELAWEAPHAELLGDQAVDEVEACAQPLVDEGTVFYGCTLAEVPEQAPGAAQTVTKRVTFIIAREIASGDELASWTNRGDGPDALPGPGQASTHPGTGQATFLLGLSMAGDRLFATMFNVKVVFAATQVDIGVYAFERTGEDIVYRWNETREGWVTDPALDPAAGLLQQTMALPPFQGLAVHATGSAAEVYLQTQGKVIALSNRQADPQLLWPTQEIGEEDVETNTDPATGGPLSHFALDDEGVYTYSVQTLYGFDRATGANPWQLTVDPSLDQRFTNSGVVLADGTLYAGGTSRDDNGTTIYAVNATTGQVRWEQRLPTNASMGDTGGSGQGVPHWHSVGDGVVVASGRDASLWVIGETEASLEPHAEISDPMPAVGEEVQVDLSGTDPGVFGEATRYRAIWGDGAQTPWKPEPVLNHTYMDGGDVTARLIAGNEANQTASTLVTFSVGATEPNMIETAFARENQDLTFGILGILVALTGGVIGVGRRYRKRSRLQDELEALEAGFEETKGNPGECEAFLDNRKARARSLLLDGVLTEEQFGVIESRVAGLHRELRTTVLDTRFQFLPHGMVGSIKKMLADGRLTAWERDALEDLLDREEALSQAQKDQVRAQLDRWFGDDAGLAEAGTDDASRG